MISATEEYATLRQELMEHQGRRLNILSFAVTVSLTLFAASAQLEIALLPLLALILLHLARVQIAEAQHGVARIAAYIRVVLEAEIPALNWETGSFWIRSRQPDASELGKTGNKKYLLYPLAVLDQFILWTGRIAILVALGLTVKNLLEALLSSKTVLIADVLQGSIRVGAYLQQVVRDVGLLSAIVAFGFNLALIIIAAILWRRNWKSFTDKNNKLATLEIDRQEAEKWSQFKKQLPKVLLELQTAQNYDFRTYT